MPQPSIDALKAIGVWMKANGEAIYGTQKSPLQPLSWGRCTVRDTPGGKVYYLHVFDWPADGKLVVPGLTGEVKRASLLAAGSVLKTESGADGLVVRVPATAPDAIATVVKVELK